MAVFQYKDHLVSGFHGRFSAQGTEYKEIYKSWTFLSICLNCLTKESAHVNGKQPRCQ